MSASSIREEELEKHFQGRLRELKGFYERRLGRVTGNIRLSGEATVAGGERRRRRDKHISGATAHSTTSSTDHEAQEYYRHIVAFLSELKDAPDTAGVNFLSIARRTLLDSPTLRCLVAKFEQTPDKYTKDAVDTIKSIQEELLAASFALPHNRLVSKEDIINYIDDINDLYALGLSSFAREKIAAALTALESTLSTQALDEFVAALRSSRGPQRRSESEAESVGPPPELPKGKIPENQSYLLRPSGQTLRQFLLEDGWPAPYIKAKILTRADLHRIDESAYRALYNTREGKSLPSDLLPTRSQAAAKTPILEYVDALGTARAHLKQIEREGVADDEAVKAAEREVRRLERRVTRQREREGRVP